MRCGEGAVEVGEAIVDDARDQRRLVAEVMVDRRRGHARARAHLADREAVLADGREELLGGVEDRSPRRFRLAVAGAQHGHLRGHGPAYSDVTLVRQQGPGFSRLEYSRQSYIEAIGARNRARKSRAARRDRSAGEVERLHPREREAAADERSGVARERFRVAREVEHAARREACESPRRRADRAPLRGGFRVSTSTGSVESAERLLDASGDEARRGAPARARRSRVPRRPRPRSPRCRARDAARGARVNAMPPTPQ